MPKGRYFLAVNDEGLIVRRAYIKGNVEGWTPRGMDADKLVECTEEENIGKIAQSPELWRKVDDKFVRRTFIKITNKGGGKLIEIGDNAVLDFKNVPEEVEEFKVMLGDKEITLKNGEELQVTSAKPTTIHVQVKHPGLYQRTPYSLVFIPPRPGRIPDVAAK